MIASVSASVSGFQLFDCGHAGPNPQDRERLVLGLPVSLGR
jgi:hypothetical protein